MNMNQIPKRRLILFCFVLFGISFDSCQFSSKEVSAPPELHPLNLEMLGMSRGDIANEDHMLWIFNGRGKIYPRRYSLTGFDGFEFKHYVEGYRFHLDFIDEKSGIRIIDNVHELMDIYDPLGWNFRPGAPFVTVPQYETWYPHFYQKVGTFHKEFDSGWVSFGIQTRTYVSNQKDEVIVAVELENRHSEPLTLTLVPVQMGEDAYSTDKDGTRISVVSDLEEKTEQGWKWTLPGNTRQIRHFAVIATSSDEEAPDIFDVNLANDVQQALSDANRQFQSVVKDLPIFHSGSEQLNGLYKRILSSLFLSRWEREDFMENPMWQVGWFPIQTAWDFMFCADLMAKIDPGIVRDIVVNVLEIGKMECSYIGRHGTQWVPILYIQDPFALQHLIEVYMTHTGKKDILDVRAGDATVYEWMNRWAHLLHDQFGTGPGGLIDVGYGTELLIEIRTDGYDHIVPVVNGMAIHLYNTLADWASWRSDPEANDFREWSTQLSDSFHKNLWNEQLGWFENMYEDGSKEPVYTYHLLDLLSYPVLTKMERAKLTGHLTEEEFLGEFGMFSISKKDLKHFDLLDCDFGGGGYYAGMPPKIALALYEHGQPEKGWDILKRVARISDHFPFTPQSPRADEPFEFRTGGNMNISSGASIEAIWFGIFGIKLHADGTMTIKPVWHDDLGTCQLQRFGFRGNSYDILMQENQYIVWRNGNKSGSRSYGSEMVFDPLP